MKKNKKNAFTLVELLAVIVILAVILVIAVPQVLDVIESSKKGSIESTVKLIANTAEKKYAEMLINGETVTDTLNCSEVVELSTSDYTNCTVSFDNEGKASVTVTGIGKFEGYVCTNGTKENANCIKGEESNIINENAISYIENLYNTAASENGLVKDDTEDENIRYAGSNEVVKNYVSFDGEIWRIIGIVNGKVKLVKEESIGSYSWDSSASENNNGKGYNIWETIEGQTKEDGTTKSDINILLNEGYYGGSYPSQCYGGISNAIKECPTATINSTLKSMVDENAIWYLGGHNTNNVQPKEMYGYERGTTVYSGHTDIAKTEWTGPVGLIYPSDYGYAADRTKCTEILSNYDNTTCTSNNWLYKNSYYWTLSPGSSTSGSVLLVGRSGGVEFVNALYSGGAVPAVYLKSNILIESGDGSSSNPYILKAS